MPTDIWQRFKARLAKPLPLRCPNCQDDSIKNTPLDSDTMVCKNCGHQWSLEPGSESQ